MGKGGARVISVVRYEIVDVCSFIGSECVIVTGGWPKAVSGVLNLWLCPLTWSFLLQWADRDFNVALMCFLSLKRGRCQCDCVSAQSAEKIKNMGSVSIYA